MTVELRQLSPNDGRDIYDMLQEIQRNDCGVINDVHGMAFDDYLAWLQQQDDHSRAMNLPENWIPQTTYFLYIDGVPVGIAKIRHHASEALEAVGVGSFGYAIAKSHRGKGYGHLLFRCAMEKCKSHGYTKVKSFVNIDNVPSNKVFVRNGAKLIGQYQGERNIYETSL